MNKKWSKRASLNLSIEAIVIVVIAFVVLGLGLGFVRGQFKSITETTSSVQEQIKQQIMEDLRTGDKKLSFPATEVVLGKKESKVIAVGVKNVLQQGITYTIKVSAIGGDKIFGDTITDNFLYTTEAETLAPTDARIIPIRITSEVTGGTGQFKIAIDTVTDAGVEEVYDTKTFFITVAG